MSGKDKISNIELVERRKDWNDRRAGDDRRISQGMRLLSEDCRSGKPRRQSDISGELNDGDIWWNKVATRYE